MNFLCLGAQLWHALTVVKHDRNWEDPKVTPDLLRRYPPAIGDETQHRKLWAEAFVRWCYRGLIISWKWPRRAQNVLRATPKAPGGRKTSGTGRHSEKSFAERLWRPGWRSPAKLRTVVAPKNNIGRYWKILENIKTSHLQIPYGNFRNLQSQLLYGIIFGVRNSGFRLFPIEIQYAEIMLFTRLSLMVWWICWTIHPTSSPLGPCSLERCSSPAGVTQEFTGPRLHS